jgi:FKBP-type peptidyl-prolyl cis-trans isomerase FkpA
MNRKRSRFVPAVSSALETLESRVVLSGIGATALQQAAAEVGGRTTPKAATATTLAVSGGTLGQPITFNVTVRAPAAQGAPTGMVNITSHGTLIQSVTLAPTISTNPRFAYSTATYTLTPQPGGSAEYFGKHAFSAAFVPDGAFTRSVGSKNFNVVQPTYTTLSDGVKIATIVPGTGTGTGIQTGQTANVMYTGYLAKNGQIFDDSVNDGGTPFSYSVGAGQVIPGFDAGTVGMQVGETRIIEIPAAEGYGATPNGSIPANSTLIFVLTLESIS